MKTNTKVVSMPQTVLQIAKQIKSSKYPKEKINIKQFFRDLGNDEYVPKEGTRIQVRDIDRDIDRIQRAVNKIKSSGNTSNLSPLTVVYFPKKNEYKILNGNHTSEMAINVGIAEMDCYIVNFETQLDSKISNVLRLGNLLNIQEVEKVDVSCNDVKRELMQLMEEKESKGLDPNPTEDEKKELVELYPQVTMHTIGQWVSNHQTVGSRRSPKKSYTQAELVSQRQSFKDNLDYVDYTITQPRTLSAWSDTGISAIFNECMEENKKKALVILYCSTVQQVDTLINSDIRARIENRYNELAKYWGLEIKTVFLRYE